MKYLKYILPEKANKKVVVGLGVVVVVVVCTCSSIVV